MEFIAKKPSDLNLLAQQLFTTFPNDNIFVLEGEMGTGKTTFIKAVADYFGVQGEVSSPTFSLVNEYLTSNNQTIYHFDLYRIKDEEELYDIGFEDYLESGNKCFIEWPQIANNFLTDELVKITIKLQENGDRLFSISKLRGL